MDSPRFSGNPALLQHFVFRGLVDLGADDESTAGKLPVRLVVVLEEVLLSLWGMNVAVNRRGIKANPEFYECLLKVKAHHYLRYGGKRGSWGIKKGHALNYSAHSTRDNNRSVPNSWFNRVQFLTSFDWNHISL